VMPHVDAFLAAVRRLPAPVALELDDGHGSAVVRAGTERIARIDLAGGRALVSIPSDQVAAMGRLFPSATEAADGIAFALADPRSRSEAVKAIRRRAQVQRLGLQYRAASP
jgi:hypothetical protein